MGCSRIISDSFIREGLRGKSDMVRNCTHHLIHEVYTVLQIAVSAQPVPRWSTQNLGSLVHVAWLQHAMKLAATPATEHSYPAGQVRGDSYRRVISSQRSCSHAYAQYM